MLIYFKKYRTKVSPEFDGVTRKVLSKLFFGGSDFYALKCLTPSLISPQILLVNFKMATHRTNKGLPSV